MPQNLIFAVSIVKFAVIMVFSRRCAQSCMQILGDWFLWTVAGFICGMVISAALIVCTTALSIFYVADGRANSSYRLLAWSIQTIPGILEFGTIGGAIAYAIHALYRSCSSISGPDEHSPLMPSQ